MDNRNHHPHWSIVFNLGSKHRKGMQWKEFKEGFDRVGHSALASILISLLALLNWKVSFTCSVMIAVAGIHLGMAFSSLLCYKFHSTEHMRTKVQAVLHDTIAQIEAQRIADGKNSIDDIFGGA